MTSLRSPMRLGRSFVRPATVFGFVLVAALFQLGLPSSRGQSATPATPAPAPGAGSVMQKALEISAAHRGFSQRSRTASLADTRRSSMFP